MSHHNAVPLIALALVIGCPSSDGDKGTPSGHANTAAPASPPYPEVTWAETVRRIEAGEVVWIVPARERRVFITTTTGTEHVTTAPTDTAIDELVTRVDPSHHRIALAKTYAKYQEVRWRDIPALVAKSTIWAVQQNGGRRVLIDTLGDDHNVPGFYVTLQPRHGDILPQVPQKYPSGMYVKHNDYQEINWKAATKLMAGELSGIFLGHGDRVVLNAKNGPSYLTIEPTPEGANDWLERHRPGGGHNLTVE